MAIVTVKMQDYAFVPDPVPIAVGDSIQWQNLDGVMHNAQRNDAPAFMTRLLGQNETSDPIQFSQASDATGFEYFCAPHMSFMRGHVVVTMQGSMLEGFGRPTAGSGAGNAKGKGK
jgi:plastocyanin